MGEWLLRSVIQPALILPIRGDEADAGDVATGPIEAGDEPKPDRVTPGREYDRNRRGRRFGRERRRSIADDHGHLPIEKVRHQKRQLVSLIRAVLDRDVLAVCGGAPSDG